MNWSRPIDSGSTENARLENRKLFKILFKLLYLRFPPLQIRTCVFVYLHFPPLHIRTYVFRIYIFHPPVLSFSVLAFSVAPYRDVTSIQLTVFLYFLIFFLIFLLQCRMTIMAGQNKWLALGLTLDGTSVPACPSCYSTPLGDMSTKL